MNIISFYTSHLTMLLSSLFPTPSMACRYAIPFHLSLFSLLIVLTPTLDSGFIHDLLLTHRDFVSPPDFFDLLIKRYPVL